MTLWPAVAVSLALTAGGAAADPAVPEPDGYRGDPYRAPVPDSLRGAAVLDADAAAGWQARGAVMIDVLPAIRRPAGLPSGTLWRAPRHDSLPNAVWLPDTGYQQLAPGVAHGFAQALARLTGGDQSAALVFFCQADCWMSWNAARRAVALGYRRVGWFPGGTDEWAASGRALAPATPVD